MDPSSPLPYHDTKPQGAADFYLAINATFQFVKGEFGTEGLLRYWEGLGQDYMKPVWQRWQQLGLPGIATYWQAFYEAEPGSEVEVKAEAGAVKLEVKRCPAIAQLRAHNREVLAEFCQHCYYISQAAAVKAGYAVRVEGGNGQCRQTFLPATSPEAEAPQDLTAITLC